MTGRGTSARVRALIADRGADVVVVDCMIPAVVRGAVASGRPVATLFHTFGGYWSRSFDRGPVAFALGGLGLRPSALWARSTVRLLLTDRELDPDRDNPTLNDFVWTGTTERGFEPLPRTGRPRILVALSSSDWPGMLPVYRRIVAALAELPVDAVLTTGGVHLGGALEGAANVEVRGWVDHSHLLPTVDLLVGHGGHSTTLKALAHGVPLLVLPINPTSDQRLIGTIVRDAGAGRVLAASSRLPAIRTAVGEMLADGGTRARAMTIGRRLRAAPPGAEVAADLILSLRSAAT